MTSFHDILVKEATERDKMARSCEERFNRTGDAESRLFMEHHRSMRDAMILAIELFERPDTIESVMEDVRTGLSRAWQEGAQKGYEYGRQEEKFDLAYAVPTDNPYNKKEESA